MSKLFIAVSLPLIPILQDSSGFSSIHINFSVKSDSSPALTILALTLSLRYFDISPVSVTITGLPVARYSPSLVGKPPSAWILFGLARARILAFKRYSGTFE